MGPWNFSGSPQVSRRIKLSVYQRTKVQQSAILVHANQLQLEYAQQPVYLCQAHICISFPLLTHTHTVIGMHGQSTVRQVELETGNLLRSKALSPSDFGEGLAKFGDK